MKISQEDFATLQELEESMWIAATRCDADYMDRILSPDFFEFGCSGRIYARAEMLAVTVQEIKATLPLKDFRIHPLADGVVQITYISEVMYETAQICNRSSIWVRIPTGWQLRFHQGTPVFC